MWLGTHPVPNLLSTEDVYSGKKATRAWNWPRMFIHCRCYGSRFAFTPSHVFMTYNRDNFTATSQKTPVLWSNYYSSTVTTSQRTHRIVGKSDSFVNVRRNTPFFVGIKRNIQMYFVNPYRTQNTESLHKDCSVLFRETPSFVRKKRNNLIAYWKKSWFIYWCHFAFGGPFGSATCTVVSCPLIGRLHRAYHLDGYIESTIHSCYCAS